MEHKNVLTDLQMMNKMILRLDIKVSSGEAAVYQIILTNDLLLFSHLLIFSQIIKYDSCSTIYSYLFIYPRYGSLQSTLYQIQIEN